MVALKRKLRLEDNLGGKAYDGDDPNGSQRKKLKTRLGALRGALQRGVSRSGQTATA
jgi:hypothetical protein